MLLVVLLRRLDLLLLQLLLPLLLPPENVYVTATQLIASLLACCSPACLYPCPCHCADFYYELGVQVIEACITSRPFTGGLMELSLVHKYVQVGGCWLALATH